VSTTTLELFFDLVFVFALTQITALMAAEPTGLGLLRDTRPARRPARPDGVRVPLPRAAGGAPGAVLDHQRGH
jgi:hypothetical protein